MPTRQPYPSVWAREAAKEPRPAKDAPSRPQIVRVAVEILDADGLDALSMRRLGTRLGMGATSIYWYVANKTELLDLAVDEVFGEVSSFGDDGLAWQEKANAFAYSLRRVMLRHPWITRLIGSRPLIGPNTLIVAEELTATLEDAGFRGADVEYASSTLIAYVSGVTAADAGYLDTIAKAGLSSDEWVSAHEEVLRAALTDLPRMRALYERHGPVEDPRVTMEVRFDFGLKSVLDGLAARLP